MQWAALIAWLATAAGGSMLILQWSRHGGTVQDAGIHSARLLSHASLAVIGLALWITYIVTNSDAFGWIAVATLAAVAAIGISMLTLWLRGRSGAIATAVPAEANFPLPIVVAHGLLATITVTLSLLALR
jgi:hypothetical protein